MPQFDLNHVSLEKTKKATSSLKPTLHALTPKKINIFGSFLISSDVSATTKKKRKCLQRVPEVMKKFGGVFFT